MKKIFIIIIILNLFSSNLRAEIAYIDISFILNNSNVGKSLNIHINKIKNVNSTKYKDIEDDLIKKEKTLIAQQNIINKDEFENKLKLLAEEIKKYRFDKKKSEDILNKIKIDNTKKILNVLNPIITKYVESNSISIVIPKKNIIVGKKKLDITNQIIKLLNDDIDRLNF
tara:strand:+ start:5606 stop:6115 length:510 start_codon:yes stop_codon:yes gene_type:complete